MAVRTKEELLEAIQNRIGEDTSDEALTLIEDVTDTIENYENAIADPEDWKSKYEENDKSWREKYKARFFSKEVEVEDIEDDDDEVKTLSYEDLFEETEEK